MFVIGALDPRVGNDRRNQLLQKLMQQYTGGQGGTIGLPSTNLMRSMPVFGAAMHPMSSQNGHPQFTGNNFISSLLANTLGPGGAGRTPANMQSPMPGTPAQGVGPAPSSTPFYRPGPT